MLYPNTKTTVGFVAANKGSREFVTLSGVHDAVEAALQDNDVYTRVTTITENDKMNFSVVSHYRKWDMESRQPQSEENKDE